MKKILIVLSLIMSMVMFASCGADAAAEKHDFRNVDFGMGSIELLEIEGKPDFEFPDDDIAVYDYYNRETFGISNANIAYYVDVDGVGSAYAVYNNTYTDNKSYQIEYQTIKKNLIAEWGKPMTVSETDEEFNYFCSWDTKFLEMYREEDNSVKLWVRAYRPDYYESYLERQQLATE
ncbi:MAG: hypothetical protein OSJ54_13735 [Oscillospiraceae bacterium]|nr:hypothetical protein [Oscillospiraceae bacterium]